MLGKPKFNYEDLVEFDWESKDNTTTLVGSIMIIDSYGTFFDSSDVSYDIMVEHSPHCNGAPCLYKHVSEKLVRRHLDGE